MNWLIYIGGGVIIFLGAGWLVKQMITIETNDNISQVIAISLMWASVSVWIWICWRFIR